MSTVAQRPDGERLPWLEPFAEPRGRRARRRGLIAAAGGAAALIAALSAGYWLGERRLLEPAPRAVSPDKGGDIAIAPVAPLPARPEPPLPATREAAVPRAPAVSEPIAKPDPAPAASPRPAARKRPPKIRREAPGRRAYEAVRAEQEARSQQQPVVSAQPAPVPVARVWPRLPSPGPPGQVIQLGAFSHPDRAYNAYRARLARYPALRAMPRVIVPIAPDSADGRMLYVLRLGTRSRNQSKSLCRSLKRRGDHCIVIG